MIVDPHHGHNNVRMVLAEPALDLLTDDRGIGHRHTLIENADFSIRVALI